MCTTLLIKTSAASRQAEGLPAVVAGRTMEFGFDVQSKILVIPKGTTLTPEIPDGHDPLSSTEGKPFKTHYGMVGANGLGKQVIVDGINDQGLYFSALYFPHYAKYSDASDHKRDIVLAPHDLGNWILGNCKSVHDVKEKIGRVVLVNTVVAELGGPAPLHFIVRDPTGEAMVIEPLGGELKLYDNPVGVMTNSPPFDWHMINLINYRGLQPENTSTVVLGGGHELPLFGQGSGMFGLPGDSTPPSRFVRAVAYSQTAVPPATAHAALLQIFHIMNAFDIPVGSITETHGKGKHKTVHRDYTVWTTAVDLTNGQFCFRTYNDQTIRLVDVKRALKHADGIRQIEMDSEQPLVDATPS